MKKKLFLIDAMALIYRAYYALIHSPRITSKGFNTSAILGFTNVLFDLLKTEKPTHIAVAFDTGAPTLRHADFADYKAQRQATPEDILAAIPYIKAIIEAFNIPILSLNGYEADDLIGTVAKAAETQGFTVFMMTSDKDYGQLVSPYIYMYKPAKYGKKPEILGEAEICEKYGIENPEQLIDLLGLWGDSSDNIPGVPGIGAVRAAELLRQFGSIENIYNRIGEIKSDKLRATLIDNEEQALKCKSLATIMLDVPLDFNFDEMAVTSPNAEALQNLFNELEFRNLAQRVFRDLALQPNLFGSNADDDVTPPETLFKTFEQQPHNFVEVFDYQTFSEENPTLSFEHNQLFFEWIKCQDKLVGFAFATTDSAVFYHFLENEKKAYRTWLEKVYSADNQIVTCQCKQLHTYLKILNIALRAPLFDVQIAHYLLQPEQSHALERLAENYLNYQILDAEKGDFNKPDAVKRVGERVEIFRQLFPILDEELKKTETKSLFETVEMPLTKVLSEMEYNGITLNISTLQKNSEQLSQDILDIEKRIYDYAGTTFNIASPKQLGEILFDKLSIISNAKLTKTKQYQTGEEVLAKLVNHHPIVPLILEYRALAKLKSTYIDALPQLVNAKTGKLHTSFNQIVTSTGRLSSTNPNLQNIPIRTERGKEIRKAFVPSCDENLILAADYSQIELRLAAAMSGDERMTRAFQNDQDIHAMTAAQVYGVDIQQVTPEMRRVAKTVNFGILYGISAFGLADRLHIRQKEAADLIRSYYDNFPKITEYLEKTLKFAQEHGYVETLFGRRRYIQGINSANSVIRKAAERNAINAPIQGTAADLIKMAMIHIFNELERRGLQTKMLLQVHDELIFEVPKVELAVVEPLVRDLMNGAATLPVPLSVDLKYGSSWFEVH